jgi:GAF domain-containing protein
MSKDPLADALVALSQFQVADVTVGDTLHRLAEISVGAVAPAAFLGMSMLAEDGHPTTAVFTDPASPEIDQAQYQEGKGPCLDAWRQGTNVRLDDVEDARDRYPAFSAACRERGIRSTLSLAMVVGESSIGAMNLYAREPAGFSDDHEELCGHLARVSGTVLANVSAYWTAFDLAEGLDRAMRTRAVIEQAKGVLMARPPYPDADRAFDMLRSASQRENVKLNAIAQRIIEGKGPPGT